MKFIKKFLKGEVAFQHYPFLNLKPWYNTLDTDYGNICLRDHFAGWLYFQLRWSEVIRREDVRATE